MRRSLIILTLLVIFITGTFVTAVAVADFQLDNIQFREMVLCGDPAAANGLQVNYQTTHDYYINWNTSWTMGSGTVETHSCFDPDQESMKYPTEPQIWMTREHFSSFSSSHYSQERPLQKLYDEMLADGGPGETVKRTIHLAEYLNYYPLEIHIQLPGHPFYLVSHENSTGLSPTEAQLLATFRSYFRIPVLPDEILEVEMGMNSDGTDYSMLSHGTTDSTYHMNSYSAVTSDACYFTFNTRGKNGSVVDTSQIPRGYGIFCLRYTDSEINADRVTTVYPLEPGIEINGICLSKDESHLYLFTEEDGQCYFHSIRLDTMELVQKLEMPGYCSPEMIHIDEEYFAANFYDSGEINVIAVYEKDEEGLYHCVLSVPYPEEWKEEGAWLLYDGSSMAYNGEKLAVTCKVMDREAYTTPCGFRLTVFDETGMLYSGDYASTQNPVATDNEAAASGYMSGPLRNNLPEIQWLS